MTKPLQHYCLRCKGKVIDAGNVQHGCPYSCDACNLNLEEFETYTKARSNRKND